MRKSLIFVFLFACQPVSQPLPEASFRALMDAEIANEIAKNCPNYSMKFSPNLAQAAVITELKSTSMSDAQAQTQIRIARQGWGEKYKTAYGNVVPIDKTDPDYYCNYGEFEIARKSAIGNLLVK